MKRALLVAFTVIFLWGCAGKDGKDGINGIDGVDGEPGTSTLLSSLNYTGTPDNNPYSYNCPGITGNNNQVVDVYMVTMYGEKTKLNFYDMTVSHTYFINMSKDITFETINSDRSRPVFALNDSLRNQCTFRVEVKTFATAQAAQAYRSQSRLDTDPCNAILYGREIR